MSATFTYPETASLARAAASLSSGAPFRVDFPQIKIEPLQILRQEGRRRRPRRHGRTDARRQGAAGADGQVRSPDVATPQVPRQTKVICVAAFINVSNLQLRSRSRSRSRSRYSRSRSRSRGRRSRSRSRNNRSGSGSRSRSDSKSSRGRSRSASKSEGKRSKSKSNSKSRSRSRS